MDEIILRQRDAAKPLTGKGFILNVAGIILKLAIAQIVVNLLIALTGVGLLNIVFYLYAIWLLFVFMKRTVACYVYTLKERELVMERRLGDSPITVIVIPLERIISMRPVKKGERLKTTYQQVTEIDPAGRPPFRMRMAFRLSLVSAHLARRCAGTGAEEALAWVLVFSEEGKLRACVFCPDEEMIAALQGKLGEAFGFDERMTRARITTVYARALQRAFPALYPYVEPLVSQEEADWAREELARRKAQRGEKKNGRAEKKPEEAAEMDGESPKKRRRKQE